MKAIRGASRLLVTDERGATAIEYGLICALIILAMVGALQGMGGGTTGMWNKLNDKVQNT